MRVPPPGDLSSDQALTLLRERLTTGDPERRSRWAAALSVPWAIDAAMRLADDELAERGGSQEAFDQRLADVQAEVARQMATWDRQRERLITQRDKDRAKLDRVEALIAWWDSLQPMTSPTVEDLADLRAALDGPR